MDHAMTVQLPEDVVDALKARAAKSGCAPEDLAALWLCATVRRLANDPLLKLAGTVRSLPRPPAGEEDEAEPAANVGSGSVG